MEYMEYRRRNETMSSFYVDDQMIDWWIKAADNERRWYYICGTRCKHFIQYFL